jgi:hypothetical protein
METYNLNLFTLKKLMTAYCNKVSSTKKRELSFEISFNDFCRLKKAKKCFYTDVKLDSSNVSFDRVINSKGYVKGNIVACSEAFNKAKGSKDISEMFFRCVKAGFYKCNIFKLFGFTLILMKNE